MTLSTGTPFINYNASGTGPYVIPFEYLDDDHIVVELRDADGVTIEAHFSIILGAVHLNEAPATTIEKVVISRWTDMAQDLALSDLERFPAKLVEQEFDKLQAQLQELSRDNARALKGGFGETGDTLGQLPPVSSRLSKWLGFDGDGKIAAYPAIDVAQASDFGVSLIAVENESLAQELLKITLPDYASLRLQDWEMPPKAVNIYKPNSTGAKSYSGGVFVLDTTDALSSDDGGTIIVDAAGNRWKRPNITFIDPRWFGLVGGLSDATTIMQAAINAAAVWEVPLKQPPITAIVTQLTISASLTWEFGGANSIVQQKANTAADLIILPSANVIIKSNGGGFDGNQANQSAGATNWIMRCETATSANYLIQGLKVFNHVNGIGINGDTVATTREMEIVDNCTFINGRQSPIGTSLRDIVLGNGARIIVSKNTHSMAYVVAGSVTNSYGRSALFVGAVDTSFTGENDFVCEYNLAENYGFAGTAALGIWEFYWRGSNAIVFGNKSTGSVQPPIRGKTNAKNVLIANNSMYSPNVVTPAIGINAPQTGAVSNTIVVADNYISGFANYTTSGIMYATGMVADKPKNIVFRDNNFAGCAGSILYQADYLDGFKIQGGFSDGSGFLLNVGSGCIGECIMEGGDYRAVTSSYGILAENNGVMTGFNFTAKGVAIEHNGSSYAIRVNADIARVLDCHLTGTGIGGVATRNVGHIECKNNKLSTAKTVGFNIGSSSGSFTTGSIDIAGNFAPGATTNAFLITSASPTGVVQNYNNSWNFATTTPTNNNLPIGTVVHHIDAAAGEAPAWQKTGAATYKAFASLAA